MVAVVIKFDVVANEVHHILSGLKNFLNKLPVNFLGNIGRIPCFNLETVKKGALANPPCERLVSESRLLAKPGQVVSVEKLAMLVQQKSLQTLFNSLLTVEHGRVEQTSVCN